MLGLSPRSRRLVKRYGKRPRTVTFERLPKPYHSAIVAYHENVDAPLPRGRKFGISELPMSVLIDAIMEDEELADAFAGWEDYHAWYMSHSGRIPRHRTLWPVILSPYDDETLEDGWHRLHSYYHYQGPDIDVPVMWYA